MTAALDGKLAVVKECATTHKVDVNKADADGTPLWKAASNGNLSVMEWLVEQGANKEKVGIIG